MRMFAFHSRASMPVPTRVYGGVNKWLRCDVSNLARSTSMGSNPVVGITNHKPTANSAVHPSEVGK